MASSPWCFSSQLNAIFGPQNQLFLKHVLIRLTFAHLLVVLSVLNLCLNSHIPFFEWDFTFGHCLWNTIFRRLSNQQGSVSCLFGDSLVTLRRSQSIYLVILGWHHTSFIIKLQLDILKLCKVSLRLVGLVQVVILQFNSLLGRWDHLWVCLAYYEARDGDVVLDCLVVHQSSTIVVSHLSDLPNRVLKVVDIPIVLKLLRQRRHMNLLLNASCLLSTDWQLLGVRK